MTLPIIFSVWLFGVALFLQASYFFFSYINQYELVYGQKAKKYMLYSMEISLFFFALVQIMMGKTLNGLVLIVIAIFITEQIKAGFALYPQRLSLDHLNEATFLVQFLLFNLSISTLMFPLFDRFFFLLFFAEFLMLILFSLFYLFRKD